MRHSSSLNELHLVDALVTIGTFDGVHLGHQAILRPLVTAAHEAGVPAVVVTFTPPPGIMLRGITEGYALTGADERAGLLGELGVDIVVTLPFDRSLASLSAAEFMGRLKESLGVKQLWVGYDFALGRGREGDIPHLRALGEQMGYSVKVVAPVKTDSAPVSSSLIRTLLREGNVTEAARLLGRLYGASGLVVHGDGRGRGIGIPTANVDAPLEMVIPGNGVYATWAILEGQRYPAVTNIGLRPTFVSGPTPPRIEALLLDVDRDLYGQTLRVEFVEFIRPEQRFGSVQELLDQIGRDRNKAREVLGNER